MPKKIKNKIEKKTTQVKAKTTKAKAKIIRKAVKPLSKKGLKIKKDIKRGVKKMPKKESSAVKYVEAVGRRKTAVARVRLYAKGKRDILVNNKDYQVYFPDLEMQKTILQPLEVMKSEDKFSVSVKVKGGGLHSQAEALRHGLAQTLVKFNADFRKRLKKSGFLTRDPRMRERKKFGLKRARRGPQWSKR